MHDDLRPAWWRSRGGGVLIGFALVATFYVLREHYAHVVGYVPYLILLLCPLMHLLMHCGHGRHPDGAGDGSGTRGRHSSAWTSPDLAALG